MTTTDERLDIPHSVEAEQALLGSLLIDPDKLWPCMDLGLNAESFYITRNGWIFQAMLELERNGQQIDFVTISEHLDRMDQLSNAGGSTYLSDLINAVPTALHAESYATIVVSTFKRRSMIHLASQMAQAAVSEDRPLAEALNEMEANLFRLSQNGTTNPVEPLSKIVSDLWERISVREREKDQQSPAILTGFRDVDNILDGLYPSELILVAARPGVGKTALLVQLGLNAALNQKRVMLFSAEMPKSQIAARMLACHSGTDSRSLRRMAVPETDWPKLVESGGVLSDLKIAVDDTCHITPMAIRSKARRQAAQWGGLDLVMVDYLQMLSPGVRLENRNREIGFIGKGLKALARELNIPVVAAAQLSRAVEQRSDKRPMLSDLRDSGELEQDADVVAFLYSDEMYNSETELKNVIDVIIAKNRNGTLGLASLIFRKISGQFLDAVLQHLDLSQVRI